MELCNVAIAAHINGKEQPNRLYVHGSALVFTERSEVTVTEAYPPSITETVLLLNLSVKHVEGPMKGTCRPFEFTKVVDGRQYAQVVLAVEGGESHTVAVSYFG